MVSSQSGLRTWLQASDLTSATWSRKYFEAIYWASTTLTTTGYGDIVPVSYFEKSFAVMCQALGILCLNYLIIMVSRAVGMIQFTA